MKSILTMALVLMLAACAGKQTKGQTDQEYGDAMAEEHGGEKPVPSGAEGQAAGALEIEGSMVEYGSGLLGYHTAPKAAKPTAAIIVIHEWWGLNDNIKAMADKLASQGYDVLAVDMYQKPAATTPDEAKALMTESMKTPEKGVSNLKAAHAYFVNVGIEKIGVIGWCFGGGWALEAGLKMGTDIAAVVMYYGRVKTTKAEVEPLTAPLLGIFAALDQGIPVDGVKQFEAALQEAGKDAQVHIYDGVDHAFANPSGERYAEDAANDAWAKTIAFFDQHL